MWLIFRTSILVFVVILVSTSISYASLYDLLKKSIEDGDAKELVRLINVIKSSPRPEQEYIILLDIWNKDESILSSSKGIVNDPYVIINVIDALVQAHNNRIIKVNKKEMREYLLALLEKESHYTSQILIIIPIFGQSEDINLLLTFLYNKNDRHFLSAINALALYCENKIDELFESLDDKYKSDVVKGRQIKEAIEFRERVIKHGYCYRSE